MELTGTSATKNPLGLNISGLFVAIFGGSRTHLKFENISKQLGQALYSQKYNIIYGGGSGGPMAAAPLELSRLGGQTIGVLPKYWEHDCGETPGHLILVDNLAERKKYFFDYSCAFVGLPGGFGTLDEILEYVTYRQMQVHSKPIILLNVDGFYDCFKEWINRAVMEGCISQNCQSILQIVDSIDDVISILDSQRQELGYSY